MITPALAVSLCSLIYKEVAAVDGVWDHFDLGLDDGVCWGLKKIAGYDVVVFRGSISAHDWFEDARAIPMETRLGSVHRGFFAGMDHVWSEIKGISTQPVVLTGHSLGAARAAILCGLMVADKAPPASRIVFGEPKPGLLDFALKIKDVPAWSFRNGDALHHDLVTDLPLTPPPFQFVHPTPIIVITCAPSDGLFAQLGVFAWHHIALYQTAIAAYKQEA
jgi:hypothetical protein